jgi:hypothetical protein
LFHIRQNSLAGLETGRLNGWVLKWVSGKEVPLLEGATAAAASNCSEWREIGVQQQVNH